MVDDEELAARRMAAEQARIDAEAAALAEYKAMFGHKDMVDVLIRQRDRLAKEAREAVEGRNAEMVSDGEPAALRTAAEQATNDADADAEAARLAAWRDKYYDNSVLSIPPKTRRRRQPRVKLTANVAAGGVEAEDGGSGGGEGPAGSAEAESESAREQGLDQAGQVEMPAGPQAPEQT